MHASYGSGRYFAGEGDWFIGPRKQRGVRGVIFAHGAGASAQGLVTSNAPATNQYKIIRAIAAVYPTVVCDLGGVATWGNAASQARVTDAKAWLQGTWGAAAGKVLLVGFSMGNAVLVNWARNNVGSVAAIAGLMPVSDTNDIYQNNRGTYQAAIGTAWAVTYPAALPAGANPRGNSTGLSGVPYKAWYASDDTITLPATVTALASEVGGSTVSLGTGGHNDSTLAAIDQSALLAFLAAAA